jgi:hypothetical protein
MNRILPALGAALLAGCGGLGLFEGSADIEVREVGRSLYCNAGGEAASVVLLGDPQAVLDWQAARGVTLAGSESLAQAPYALIDMGVRPTGGYGLAVARAAVLRGERVTLSATFVSPPPGSISTQALSSPCVLVQLPRGRYGEVEVLDQTGAVRATGGRPQPPAPVPAAPAAPEGAPPDAPAAPPSDPPPAETPLPAEPAPGAPAA